MKFWVIIVVSLAGCLFMSCKPQPKSALPQPAAPVQAFPKPAAARALVQAKELIGGWKTKKGGVGDEISFEMENGEGVYRSFLESRPMEVGAWTLAGNTLSISIECRSCGTTDYRVSLKNNILTLEPASGDADQYQKIIEEKPAAALVNCAEVLRKVRDQKLPGLNFSEPVEAALPGGAAPEKATAKKGLKMEAEVKGGQDFGELNQKAGQVGKYLESIGFAIDEKSISEIVTGYQKSGLSVSVALEGSSENAQEPHQIVVFCSGS